jgi:endonuclease G
LKALTTARGVFQETEGKRLLNRLSAVAGKDLNDREVAQLAKGDLSLIPQLNPPAQREVIALLEPKSLSSEARGELEKIVGTGPDYVSIAFVDLARAAARSVARVVDQDRHPVGSGVMVSPLLFMTNNHVIKNEAEALAQVVQFDYELGIDDTPRQVTEFRPDPETFFFTSPDFDFTLVALAPRRLSGSNDLDAVGYAPLQSGDDKHAIGDFVTVIEHPDGNYKQIALRENRVIGRGRKGITLHYGADTLPGASGSPVFNDRFQLVALHHAGGNAIEAQLQDGRELKDLDSNEGIRVSAIIAALHVAIDTMSTARRNVLLPALDPPARGPSGLTGSSAPEKATTVAVMEPQTTTETGVVASAGADGWVRTVIPVQVAIQIGQIDIAGRPAATGVAAAASLAGAALYERNDEPDQQYFNRRGYAVNFLREDVPLPIIDAILRQYVVQPTGNQAGDPVLRYLHFSTVQRGDRRMPFFTAVNIDGKRSRNINRATGEVEATEKWYTDPRLSDPRLSDPQQLDQSIFEKQKPRIFDRGHMVRRLDPAWGSKSVAKRASDDTFHFANCCPQVANFNQSARIWAGIENYVLDNARAAEERICVFTGPIFADDDPDYRGIKVPKAFWKVLTRIDGEELRATGFIASQADLLKKWLGAAEAFESWDDLGTVVVYQQRIERIEAATKLSFGTLRDHDTAPATEALVQPLASFDDVSW